MVMFMRPRREGAPVVATTQGWTRFVMMTTVAAILILGLVPDSASRYANVGMPILSAPSDAAKVTAVRPVAPAVR